VKKQITFINKTFAEICGWLLSVIMVLLAVDFIGRGLSMPVIGVAEIAVFAMVAVVYLGLPHCEEQRGHVRVEAVLIRLPKKIKALIDLCCYLLAIFIIAIAIYAAGANAVSAYVDKEAVQGPTPLLTFPVKIVMVIGLIFYLVQLVINFFEDLKSGDLKKMSGF